MAWLFLDASGRIIIANTGFKRYAQAVSPEKRFYWEVVRSIELDELVKDIIANKTTESKELVINEKTLLCKGIYLIFRNEIVLTFNDITEIKNIEKIKRDFVSNISHELRTPLTSIKGYAETLEETVNEEGKRYLDIILRNTERLINIVQDLLLLSELEEVKSLNIEELDLKALLENVMKIFDQKAKDKGLEISVSAEDNFPIIEADAFKLEQVFINILDNAVKYTERGEIAISLKNEIDDVIIEIEDTGIGMPQKDLVRIFERFYVVDKSRSRKMGGTGLGLSIVKHIILLHNGKINVESAYGVGTKLIITLPITQTDK
jgi:two-component system phosphate regulon sensor histidine kinase PhoR